MQGSIIKGELVSVLKGRSVNREIKKNVLDSILLLVATCGCEMWTAREDILRIQLYTCPYNGCGVKKNGKLL